MRILTKYSICSDPTLSQRQKFFLLDKLEVTPFPIQWSALSVGQDIIIHILYPGAIYNPKDCTNVKLPSGYDGGGGSLSIQENLEKITHHYIRGINGIKIRFQANGVKAAYHQRYQVSGGAQKALSGFIFKYYEIVGLVAPNDLVVEIISNIIIHAPSPEVRFYTNKDLEELKM